MRASIATPVAARWAAVSTDEAGSRCTSAAIKRHPPAVATSNRASLGKGASATAIAINAMHTMPIAKSTALAAGIPGCASRLIVLVHGS